MSYSNKIKSLTVEILEEMPIDSFIKGYCCLKSEDGRFGKINTLSALDYKWEIREMDSEKLIQSFQTVDELVRSGWVVD